jgi:hypothetical protein
MKPTRHLWLVVCLTLLLSFTLTIIGATQKSAHKRDKAGTTPSQQGLNPTCTNPSFPEPAPQKKLGIDTKCGLVGAGGKEATQNTAKNNFCASGTPSAVTIASLTKLQASVEKDPTIPFGSKGPAIDRTPLQKLGEGRLVTLKAFVLFARQEGKESVNCGTKVPNNPLFHDIHISLVDAESVSQPGDTKPVLNTKECTGVVAEMSPHHRPDKWTAGNLQKVAKAQLPVRVTGQLFFDSSHLPCANGQPVGSNPKRISLWEIHPIYKFEVCTANCNGAGTWLPLDQWVSQQ